MKTMILRRNFSAHVAWALTAIACATGARPACGQAVPLDAVTPVAILDENGQPLANSRGALVQFLLVGSGIQPPSSDGQPSPSNTVLFSTRVGNGVADTPALQGLFDAAVTPRPSGPVFARVFNRSTAEASSFYADSQPFTPNGTQVFAAAFGLVSNVLDSADSDGDGINNSWEKNIGSDPLLADSDGDGTSDPDELRLGTSPADPRSNLSVVRCRRLGDGSFEVHWASMPAKQYKLQWVALDGAPSTLAATDLTPVVEASSTDTVSVVDGAGLPATGFFRVIYAGP